MYLCLERTTLSGRVAHEVNCIAVENAESERLIALRTLEAMRPKKFTKFINEDLSTADKGFIQPGTINAQNAFGDFIVCSFPLLLSTPTHYCAENKGPSCRPTRNVGEGCGVGKEWKIRYAMVIEA
jgi:hypothetical protein